MAKKRYTVEYIQCINDYNKMYNQGETDRIKKASFSSIEDAMEFSKEVYNIKTDTLNCEFLKIWDNSNDTVSDLYYIFNVADKKYNSVSRMQWQTIELQKQLEEYKKAFQLLKPLGIIEKLKDAGIDTDLLNQ